MFYGRKYELGLLEEHYNSRSPQLAIIYGRRRIGKSELIKQFMKGKHSLYFEALEGASQARQIDHFLIQLSEQIKAPKYGCKTWREIFDVLTEIIKTGRWLVVFDELPWMALRRSSLVSLLKFYWDQKWKNNPSLMLILCGSVASFMIDHIVHSQALHNRKTLEMRLIGLPPADVKDFLSGRSAREIAQIMMMVGGVPKYLEAFDPGKSTKINVNKQFFTKDGFFVNEFETIFKEQFRTTAYYEAVVRLLSEKGLSLTEISRQISFESGGTLGKYLRNLERAGFIEEWSSVSPYGVKTKTRKYKLSDPFLRTYFKFIAPNKNRIIRNTTANLADSIMGGVWESFFGQAFDWLVYASLDKLLAILEIPPGDLLQFGPFFKQRPRGDAKGTGCQIDLMLVRKDGVITVVENKFSEKPVGSYVLDDVHSKIDRLELPKRFTVEKVLIAASGVTKAVSEAGYFNKIITLENLFA